MEEGIFVPATNSTNLLLCTDTIFLFILFRAPLLVHPGSAFKPSVDTEDQNERLSGGTTGLNVPWENDLLFHIPLTIHREFELYKIIEIRFN